MTNITDKNELTDMQLHIDKAYHIIDDGPFPNDYVAAIRQKLKDNTISSGVIRNFKNRVTKYPQTRINVLTALVEVAQEFRQDVDKLKSLTK